MTDKTSINPILTNDETVLNPISNNQTMINTATFSIAALPKGTLLLDKYTVQEPLNTASGEARLYICTFRSQKYVAKIYNRSGAIKSEVVENLKSTKTPYVAKIVEVGEYYNYTVTILPYYELGSLKNKRIALSELKSLIIPCINEALKDLHSVGILHKDLKPENIMVLPNNAGIALIDFGISSVIDEDVRVLVTQTGWTLSYASPEALRGIYLEESDYYSFGITLYELFCGYTPYQNLTQDEMMQYLAVQKLPFPQDMPIELKNLIIGLTYADITHRNEQNNPNRRWTYNEVKNWLAGKAQNIPGEIAINSVIVYKFCGQKYPNISKLAVALMMNPTEGKKHLSRKLLSNFFSNNDPEIASYCMDAEDEIRNGNDINLVYWRFIYRLSPKMKNFFWADKNYPSLANFGQDVLNSLRSNNLVNRPFWDEVMAYHLSSEYLKIHGEDERIILAVKNIEDTNIDRGNDFTKYYLLAYLVIKKPELKIANNIFHTTEELSTHINELMLVSLDDVEHFCYNLITEENRLNPEFEAWLIVLGKRKELEKWKETIEKIG